MARNKNVYASYKPLYETLKKNYTFEMQLEKLLLKAFSF